MRIFLDSLGCRLNHAEMSSLGRQLQAAGHALARSAAEADFCIINSCAVTGDAARRSRQLARQLARANPAARLVVTGCYATLEGEAAARLPNVALVVGNERKDALLSLLDRAASEVRPPVPERDAPAPLTSDDERASRTRAFVKVQDGCRNHCTFCVVTVARGAERSRPAGAVVAEVNALHAEGFQEAVITGVHLGGYGSDSGSSLRELIEGLLGRTAIPRIRLSSLEPFDLAPDFFDLWAAGNGRLMPHLHLPAQSGSDAVLKRMARRNRTADFENLVAAARACVPGLTITTDIITGFPGETEDEHTATVDFVRRVGFAHTHVFPYSAREGTAAARFVRQVPDVVRRQRTRALTELDAELSRAVRESFAGQVRQVLWENRPAADDPSVWSGLTDNYLRVRGRFPGADMHNRITAVRLRGLCDGELWGELAEESEDLGYES